MRFDKHPHKPSTYAAEDTDSGHRYTISKTPKGDWQLAIIAGGYVIERHYGGSKKILVEQAQAHNARLWADNMQRLHGKDAS